MRLFTCNHRAEICGSITVAEGIHANGLFLFAAQQGRDFLALDLIPGLPQQLQQRFKAVGLLCQRIVNGRADSLPVGGFLFVAQPLVVALAVALRILHDGVAVLDADGIVEPPHGAAAAPKVSEFPGLAECGGVPDHMIVNMGFVDMGADDIGVIALGEALGQLTAQTVRFLRCDLSGNKGLPQMVGDHIILAAHSAGLLDVLILGEKKLGVGDPAVALPACYQPAAVRLLRIFGVVDDSADGLSHRAAFAGVERHQARGCHVEHLLEKSNGLPKQTV